MKRGIAFLLALMMLLGSASAEQLTMDTQYDGLRDKMYRQYAIGGLRGVLKLDTSGRSDFAMLLAPFAGAQLDFRTTVDQNTGSAEFKSSVSKNGINTLDQIHLWSNGESLYLGGNVLMNTVLRFPWRGDFFSSLTGAARENPSFLSAVLNIALHGHDLDPLLTPIRTHVEDWLMRHAQNPETFSEAGETLLRIRYVLPPEDIREEMKALLHAAASDAALVKKLTSTFLYLTEAQQRIALSDAALSYDEQVIDQIPLSEGITAERIVTTLGEQRAVEVRLPLSDETSGSSMLIWNKNTDAERWTLEGERRAELTVSEEEAGWAGKLTIPVENERSIEAVYRVTRAFSETEADGIAHEITTLNLSVDPEEGSEPFEPVSLVIRIHLYSRTGSIKYPTTMELQADGTALGAAISLKA